VFLVAIVAIIVGNVGVLILAWSFFSVPPEFNELVVRQGTLISVSECIKRGRHSSITITIASRRGEIKESFHCNVDVKLLVESIGDHIEVRREEDRFFKGSMWHIESEKGVVFDYKERKDLNQSPFSVILQLLLLAAYFYYSSGFIKDLYKSIDRRIGKSRKSDAGEA